jgi:hypothetical protein
LSETSSPRTAGTGDEEEQAAEAIMLDRSELRDSYAEIGDVGLHYLEAGDGR